MSDPYLGQIITFGGNFAIRGYAFCNGQIMSIAQNTALFSILGTTYGGNGSTTFGLPDLRGRVPVGTGQGPGLGPIQLGQISGTESVTLTLQNLPAHNHQAVFSSSSTLNVAQAKATLAQAAAGSLLARGVDGAAAPAAVPRIYAPAGTTPIVPLGGLNVAGTVTVGIAGSNVPFASRDPYLGLTQLIAVQGIFPSRN